MLASSHYKEVLSLFLCSRLASKLVLHCTFLKWFERLSVGTCLLGQVLIVGHGIILRFGFLSLNDYFLLFCNRIVLLSNGGNGIIFFALSHGPLGLLGIVLIRTPIVTTPATLLNLLTTTGARSTIVGALPVAGWDTSATSSFAVVVPTYLGKRVGGLVDQTTTQIRIVMVRLVAKL
jgi:hypothetical protein